MKSLHPRSSSSIKLLIKTIIVANQLLTVEKPKSTNIFISTVFQEKRQQVFPVFSLPSCRSVMWSSGGENVFDAKLTIYLL
jgi:hypothetical protein